MEVKEIAKEAKGGKRTRMSRGTTTTPVERKEMERERRQHMKELCAKLVSIIPKEHCSSNDTTLLGSLDQATAYIKKLKDRVGELHQRRSSAQALARLRGGAGSGILTPTLMSGGTGSELVGEEVEKTLVVPAVEFRHHDDSSMDMARLRGAGSGISTPKIGGTGSKLEGEEVERALAAPVVELRHHDDSSMDVMLICSIERPIKLHEVITILEEEGAEIINANHSVAGNKIFYTIHSQAFSSRIGIDVSRISERVGALV